MKKIKIIENFISWQGESVDAGKRMLFLRYKFCNRNCNFCDSQVRMRITNEFEISINEIQDLIDKFEINMCITGGEPTIDVNLQSTIDIINKVKCNLFNVETNGFQLEKLIKEVNPKKNITYVLSPKLFTQDDYTFYSDLVDKIKDNDKVIIKLVTEDRPMIHNFLNYLIGGCQFNMNKVWCMPEGKTRDELLSHSPFVLDMAERYKTNFSSREHIIYNFI